MKKLLAVILITLVSCTENTKASKIQTTPAKEKSETQVQENKNISGNWIFTEKSQNSDIPTLQFTVTVKQDGEEISGQYCAVANSGAKIDCENETRYNLKGKLIDGKFTGSFYSFFGSSKDQGTFEISVIDNNTINWKVILSPKGEFYAPQLCRLQREISTVSSTDTKKVFPLSSTGLDHLNWDESNKYVNYNYTYNLPDYKNSAVILAKNDLSDDPFYTLFTLNKTNKVIDSLKISYTEDGYPENDKRYFFDFVINSDYTVTVSKSERKDYNKIKIRDLKYKISDGGTFVKIAK
ncbi:hypothetical protein ASG31_11510 [Chryseobacterium sp. Leaf404]|uniref:hypothetical protein n=1 Tax=unclassified Chryseobacterium TaxID=2593645 RepID=UPI0006FC2611|nr:MULTISPECIES: hypothetical protein [unclassified Chryseobacterium]KQT16985.1 hypothetical protein ASG31_11510 [Chryseobacterium sp. Leaf404]